MTFTQDLADFVVGNEVHLLFIVLVAAFVLSALVEGEYPRKRQAPGELRRRWLANFGLMLLDQLNVTWVTMFATVLVAGWAADQNFGLLPHLDIGFWPATLLTFLTFELISYTFHRLLHAVPMLWRIHAIHHSDTAIDFSTTFRNHPLELLVIAPVTVPVVALLGFPPASIVLYQIVRTTVIIFAHSTIRLPEIVDRYLRLAITTPDYHRIHHSSDRFYTDSNFCPAFPVYDYLFGTAKKLPYRQLPSMELGLEYLREPGQTSLLNLLLLPFRWKKQVAVDTADPISA